MLVTINAQSEAAVEGSVAYQASGSEGAVNVEETDGILEGTLLERRVGGRSVEGSHCGYF